MHTSNVNIYVCNDHIDRVRYKEHSGANYNNRHCTPCSNRMLCIQITTFKITYTHLIEMKQNKSQKTTLNPLLLNTESHTHKDSCTAFTNTPAGLVETVNTKHVILKVHSDQSEFFSPFLIDGCLLNLLKPHSLGMCRC